MPNYVPGRIELPAKLLNVFSGEALYRGAYGGRGSAKSRSFAKMAAVHGLRCAQANESGVIVCGREFQNSLDDSSMAEVKAAIESEPWLAAHYDVGEKYIRTRDGKIDFLFAGLRRNIESVKSTSRIRLLWVDEAEPVSEAAWQKAIPTVREEGAEIWITWNPERRASATNQRFRINPPENSKFAEVNFRDNPWFPKTLDQIRREDLAKRPEMYPHIWEGQYAVAHAGAYYAAFLSEAQREGRICTVGKDPLLPIRAFCDIGGTGARSDAFAIWIAQFVGREIRLLDYYEAVGQPLSAHVEWIRERGWGKAQIILPHDGATHDRVYAVSFESAFFEAGFNVDVIPNQGRGAARSRIEAARRLFPICWFNANTTEPGRDALGWYHERKSEDVRDVGLGPEHDWCLAGDTEVITRDGLCAISKMAQTGEVLTLCGWRPYHSPRVTRRNAPLVEVTFSDGYAVKCTPEHMFLTANGWRSAGSLDTGLSILCGSTRSRGILRAVYTGFIRASAITCAAARRCIALFGRVLSGLFPMAATFTTSTAIPAIAGWRTSNACPPKSTSRLLDTNESISESTSPQRREALLLRGIALLKAANGTIGMPYGRRVGQSGSASLRLVCNVARRICDWSGLTGAVRSIARVSAKHAHIRRVVALSETQDVWCLTVPDGHSFALANGVISHNSSNCADAFGLLAVAYEAPRGRPTKLTYPAQAAFV